MKKEGVQPSQILPESSCSYCSDAVCYSSDSGRIIKKCLYTIYSLS